MVVRHREREREREGYRGKKREKGMGKEGMSEGEGEGAHTPPFEGERERERDIDPHTHTHTRTILLTADRLNQHTLYESKYVCRRESKAKRTRRERNRSAHTHTSIGCTWGDGVLEVHTSIASLTEREKRSSVVCTRKHKSLEPGLSLSRS